MSRWDKICNNMLLYLVLLACALTKHAEEVMEGSVGFKNKALSLVTFWLVVRCCCPYAAYLGQLTSKWWICGEQRLGLFNREGARRITVKTMRGDIVDCLLLPPAR